VLSSAAARVLAIFHFIGEFSQVFARGFLPGNWRRTMRHEFGQFLYQVGFRAIPAVVVAAALVGLGLVVQIIYWLNFAGEQGRVGEFIVMALVREIAPILTALIMIGRSGSVLVDEVGQMTRSGHLRLLASHGIDPIDFIVIPRSFAMAVATFLLTMVFLHTALWVGYLTASAAGLSSRSPLQFIGAVNAVMTLKDHLLLVTKPLLVGYVVSYISIWLGMRVDPGVHGVRRALPKAFVFSLLATFAIGALISAVL
jgi:phospholipid/cholesterol/gamma-HCH transport system permease protein